MTTTVEREARMPRLPGMTLTAKRDGFVAGTFALGTGDIADDGRVDPAVILCAASRLARYAAQVQIGPRSTTLDCKTGFLVPCRATALTLEATLVHKRDTVAVWRVAVFDPQRSPVGEVTQTETADHDVKPVAAVAADKPPGAIELVRNERGRRAAEKDTATERREQIMRGACEVIGKKGYAGASVRDIAAASGMPVPTMYQYVQSKEDILALIYNALLEDTQAQLEEGLASGGSATEKLDLFLRSQLVSLNKYRREVLLMFQESKNLLPQARAKVFEADRAHTAMWEQLLRDGHKSGEFQVEDIVLTANFIRFLCTVWPLRHWAIGRHGFDTVLEDLRLFVFRALAVKIAPVSDKPRKRRVSA